MILYKRVREEEHDFIIGTSLWCNTSHMRAQIFQNHDFFLDFLMFIAFVQNNCCGNKKR